MKLLKYTIEFTENELVDLCGGLISSIYKSCDSAPNIKFILTMYSRQIDLFLKLQSITSDITFSRENLIDRLENRLKETEENEQKKKRKTRKKTK